MPSTLVADNNGRFGGVLINEKYSPLILGSITIVDGDKSFIQKFFNNRITLLQNLFPRKLTLFTQAWPDVDEDTPPMVVISSGRAEWMKTLFENAKAKNRAGAVTGYNDTKTFDNGPLPWYSPYRSQRPVYILVHHSEYGYYRSKLTGYPNVCVVGWLFPFPKKSYGPTGFGVCRFAAIELAKSLGYHRAWLVDDNVVNVNGFPNRLTTIEALMNDETAAIGFTGCTNNEEIAGVYEKSTFTAAGAYPMQAAPLLQQVVLWNLDFLNAEGVKANFSPYFVASNEDVSLTNFLLAGGHTKNYIKALSVIKMQPDGDKKNAGMETLKAFKKELLKLLFEQEKKTQIQMGVAAPVNLEAFVNDTIIENCQNKKSDLHQTQSMVIEQVLALAVTKNWAPPKIFNPYSGFPTATVERRAG